MDSLRTERRRKLPAELPGRYRLFYCEAQGQGKEAGRSYKIVEVDSRHVATRGHNGSYRDIEKVAHLTRLG